MSPRPDDNDADKAERRKQARTILDRVEHHEPPPGKEPHPISDIPEAEKRGNYRHVHGGGEAV